MNIDRYDVFEDEKEVSVIVDKLQSNTLKYMAIPDAFSDTKSHELALKSTHKMGKKVLATL